MTNLQSWEQRCYECYEAGKKYDAACGWYLELMKVRNPNLQTERIGDICNIMANILAEVEACREGNPTQRLYLNITDKILGGEPKCQEKQETHQ